MSTDARIAAVKEAIVEFPWWNYGLDEVDNAQSDEWAEALAEAVVAALEPAVRESAAQS
jgi:hypothetical protein